MAVDKDNIPVVVVAEDDELLRLHAADILADAGYEVINVPDADAALQAIAKRPEVRVLFTDIQMPGKLNGIELARKVHELWPRVLLLVTSAVDGLRSRKFRTMGISSLSHTVLKKS